MFTFLRSKKKSITNILLAGFLALLMMSWGADYYTGSNGRNQTDAAIKVNGEAITYAQFNEQLQNIRQVYRQRFGAAFDQIAESINLEQQAVDSIIDQTLGESFIRSLNLVVGGEQVRNRVFSLPFFQKFPPSQESYRQFLQSIGMRGDQLEQVMEQEIANEILRNTLADLTTPTTAELKLWIAGQNTKFDFNYVEISSESFVGQAAPKDDSELNAYFETNKEMYRQPKSARFSYVKFKSSDFESKVVVAEEDIAELYQAKKASLGDKPLTEVRTQLEAELRATEAPQYSRVEAQNFFDRFNDVRDSKSLADFAKEKGLTVYTSGKLLSPTEVPNDDREAEGLSSRLVSASTGETKLVELPAADFVAVVEETKESYLPALDEVRAGVSANYRASKSKELARTSAEKLLEAVKLAGGPPKERLVANLKGLKVEVKTEKGVSKGDESSTTPVFASPATKQSIFSLSAKNPIADRVFEFNEKFYVIVFAGSSPATEEDIKKVYAEYRETERAERTTRLMGGIKRALRKDADIWIDKDIVSKSAG
jgi:peptidyl-prolyl cis-trans isomerase D